MGATGASEADSNSESLTWHHGSRKIREVGQMAWQCQTEWGPVRTGMEAGFMTAVRPKVKCFICARDSEELPPASYRLAEASFRVVK